MKTEMNIKVNNKEMQIEQGSSLQQLAETMALPEKGVAVAVNNRMVPRAEWPGKTLSENDQIVVIKAACGG